ncbi:MAG: biotin transporter BioY [Butyrivibrio sp.]|nr:biotin transporter BioY [Butyrivibrio sp.]
MSSTLDSRSKADTNTIAGNKSNVSIQDLCMIAVFTAIISVLSQLSIPMPAGVPMTLQTLIIPIAGIVLGKKKGSYATLLYLLLGAVGVPVFAGFAGGFDKLIGMTGGFLVSFPVLSFTAGLGDEIGKKISSGKKGISKTAVYFSLLVASLLIGATINYVIGTLWFMFVAKAGLMYSLTACVFPFIPTAIVKIILVAVLGPELKKRLSRFI